MTEEEKIIAGCKKYKKKYQLLLYEKYAPILGVICMRYASSEDEANDILQDGFIKIFSKIKTFKGEGSFEGWMKKIIINTSITHIKKKNRFNRFFFQLNENIDGYQDDKLNSNESVNADKDFKSTIYNAGLSKDEINSAINELPKGFRTIFNLYTFENLKHNEIAELLGISTGNSKSQLSRARKQLQGKLYELSVKKRKEKKVGKE